MYLLPILFSVIEKNRITRRPAARAEPAPVHSLPADILCRTLTAYESDNVLEHVARVAQVHPDWWKAARGSAAYGLGMWRRTDVLRQISRSLKLKGPHQWSQPGSMHRLRLVLPVLPGDEAGRAFGAVLRAMPVPFRFIHLEMRGPVRSTDVYPELTPSGLAPIADAMRRGFAHGILRKLDVTNNRGMGDEGIAMLAKALPPTLEVLSMARTGCGDAGMVAIAATLPSTHIEALDLGWNPDVRETGWLALAAAMPHTPALKVLWLSDSRGMGDAGVQVIPTPSHVLDRISPIFSPFFARFHRLDEAVPTSPNPESRATKQRQGRPNTVLAV